MTMTREELEAFIESSFPHARRLGWTLDDVGHRFAVLRLPVTEEHLRPGGTVSGPALMALADTAAYFAILASIGPVALAVTTHLSIDFLRRPDHPEIVVRADLVKLGSRLAVARVDLRGSGEDEPVAIASVTYSIPQRP
jgi:uncharacterized protein (TIGR00369 family)